MEPGFSASCLHSILSSASHKHSSSLSSRLHHSCLSSPTCCTLLPASPTMITMFVSFCLWKTFVPLFIRFRREWNIRNSLVDAFATLFLLSYVKILSVSMDLLMPVPLYAPQGHIQPQLYLFNQGDVAFLGSQHLPYACLALFFLLIFTLLPMLLLFLYPSSCFQVCLNHTGCSYHTTPSRDTTRMVPMVPVTSDSSQDFTSSSEF